MTNTEFSEKYNTTLQVARWVFNKEPVKVRVATFNVYDSGNPSDPELIKMNHYLNKHPECEKVYWQQQGPCSNWGYDIYRLETQEEFNKRIKEDISKAEEKIKFLKENQEQIRKLSYNCEIETIPVKSKTISAKFLISD